MKPVLQKLNYPAEKSFIAEKYNKPYFEMPWHFHSEYELVWITKGYGKRYVNEHVDNFKEGDLVFVGSNLPHFWRSDMSFYDSKKVSESVFLMFTEMIFPQNFKIMPEYKNIAKLLKNSNRGIKIKGRVKKTITNNMSKLLKCGGLESTNILMETLDAIGNSKSLELLSSAESQKELLSHSDLRLEKVLLYINNNYLGELSLDLIADMANMNSAAFCRYFKNNTGKTLVQYINDIRLSYSCKLLMDKNLSVAQVCYESGFNSLSFFYRIFKENFGKTPIDYQREFA